MTQATPSATRRVDCSRRGGLGYGCGSPFITRARASSRGPAEMLPLAPSPGIQSSDSVRGDRPASMVAMITGHASTVVAKRHRTLFDGINRSAYPTAPSTRIPEGWPGIRVASGWRHSGSVTSISGMKNSSSGSSFVRMSFALRGAPCRDDSRLFAAFGRYHDQQPPLVRVSDRDPTIVLEIESRVRTDQSAGIKLDRPRLVERDVVLCSVFAGLPVVPPEIRHRRTVGMSPYAGLTR